MVHPLNIFQKLEAFLSHNGSSKKDKLQQQLKGSELLKGALKWKVM